MTGGWTNPIEQILGPDAASGSPFDLLGVEPRDWDRAALTAARDRRLAAVDAHPAARTPAADEVRIALHAATAQLANDVVRRHLLKRFGIEDPTPDPIQVPTPGSTPDRTSSPLLTPGSGPGPAPTSGAAPSPAQSPRDAALTRDVTIALGLHGGWRPGVTRHLAAIAAVHGVAPEDIASAVQRAVRPEAFGAAPATPPPARRAPHPARAGVALPAATPSTPTEAPDDGSWDDDEPAETPILASLAVSSVILLGFVLLGTVLFAINPGDPGPPPPAAPQAAAPPAASVPDPAAPAPQVAEAPEPAPPPAPAPRPPPGEIAESLRAAAGAMARAPEESLDRFARAVDDLASTWPAFGRSELVAANTRVVEALIAAAGQPGLGESALRAIAGEAPEARQAPDEVFRAAWSAGMLLRLRGQPGLPSTTERLVEQALSRVSGVDLPRAGGFDEGALAVLVAAPARLVHSRPRLPRDPAEAFWERWTEAVRLTTASDERARSLRLIAAGDALLLHPDAHDAPFARRGVAAIVKALDWSAAGTARRWLLATLENPGVSPGALHVLTEAVVADAAPEGTDLTMVLSRTANDRDRRSLRERFAHAWGLSETASDDAVIADIRERLRPLEASDPKTRSPIQALTEAGDFAALSAAAAAHWRGDADALAAALESRAPQAPAAGLVRPFNPAGGAAASTPLLTTPTAGGAAPGGAGAAGAWAVEFHTATDAGAKLRLIRAFPPEGSRLAVDAELLVEAAVFDRASAVREEAANAVRLHADDPLIVNGLLELAPRLPRTPAVTRLAEDVSRRRLPSRFGGQWGAGVRRALIERLLELLAEGSDVGAADRLAGRVAEMYMLALGAPGSAVSAGAPEPGRAARLLRDEWTRLSDRSVAAVMPGAAPAEVERRLAGRLALARGAVQAFAAEQMALVETMGGVVAGEQPLRAEEVREVLREFRDARRTAGHVFEQVRAGERAMVRLWIIRYGGARP